MRMPGGKLPLALALVLGTAACNSLPGRPGPVPSVLETGRLTGFGPLYSQNCAACHGTEGHGGAAIALADPVYLAIADNGVIRKAIANGIAGTPMPAFAQAAGGTLNQQQINTLVEGLREWAQPGKLAGEKVPPYAADLEGNGSRGAQVYFTFCSSCHGPDGGGGKKAGSVINPSFLALVSDQGLRTLVIVGRPELGAPDWRADLPGHPMTDQEITDVVSWLAAHRVAFPGEPYPQGGPDGAGEAKQ